MSRRAAVDLDDGMHTPVEASAVTPSSTPNSPAVAVEANAAVDNKKKAARVVEPLPTHDPQPSSTDHNHAHTFSPIAGSSVATSQAELLKTPTTQSMTHITEKVDDLSGKFKMLLIVCGFIALILFITMCLAAASVDNTKGLMDATGRNGQQIDQALRQLMPGFAVGSPSTWEEVHPASGVLPQPRLAHASVGIGKKMYVHGGFYGDSTEVTVYNDLWVYTEDTNSWEQLTTTGDVPSGRLHHSLVDFDDGKKMLLFGGFNTFVGHTGHASMNDLYELNVATLVWTRVTLSTTVGAPSSRGAHDATFTNGFMYLFGGFETIGSTGHSHELFKYSPTERRWYNLTTTAPTDPTWPDGRIGFAWTPVGTKIHMFGGGCDIAKSDDDINGQCGDDWLYDPSTNTFTELITTGNKPSHRRATHGDVSVFGMVYLFGGVHINTSGATMLDDLYVLDVENAHWMRLYPNFGRGKKPPVMFGHTVVRLGAKIVVFGGRVGTPTSKGSNGLWEYHVVRPL